MRVTRTFCSSRGEYLTGLRNLEGKGRKLKQIGVAPVAEDIMGRGKSHEQSHFILLENERAFRRTVISSLLKIYMRKCNALGNGAHNDKGDKWGLSKKGR